MSNGLPQILLNTGKLLQESDTETGHKKAITSLSKSIDGTHFINGSLDKSAKLWDIRTMTLLKTYLTERPVNAVTMSPLLDHVVLGGGQDASAVTTTDQHAGKVEAKFYDKILQEEIEGVKGHFWHSTRMGKDNALLSLGYYTVFFYFFGQALIMHISL